MFIGKGIATNSEDSMYGMGDRIRLLYEKQYYNGEDICHDVWELKYQDKPRVPGWVEEFEYNLESYGCGPDDIKSVKMNMRDDGEFDYFDICKMDCMDTMYPMIKTGKYKDDERRLSLKFDFKCPAGREWKMTYAKQVPQSWINYKKNVNPDMQYAAYFGVYKNVCVREWSKSSSNLKVDEISCINLKSGHLTTAEVEYLPNVAEDTKEAPLLKAVKRTKTQQLEPSEHTKLFTFKTVDEAIASGEYKVCGQGIADGASLSLTQWFQREMNVLKTIGF